MRPPLAVAAATLSTSLLWLAAQALDIDLRVDQGNGQPPMVVSLPLVIGFTLALTLAGWGTLVLFERFVPRGRIVWTVLATAVLALSFLPVLASDATSGTKLMLSLMHLAAGALLIPATRTAGTWSAVRTA